MDKSQAGLSAMTGLLIIVIIIAAAFYVAIPMVSSSSSTSTSGLPGTSTTSSSSASTSSGGGSTGKLTISTKQPLIVAPDLNESVPLTFAAVGSVSGNYTLSVTGLPSGVTASFNPKSLSLPAQLHQQVSLVLSASKGAQVVNSTVNVVATAGSSVYQTPMSLMSVPALVIIQGSSFNPSSLSVSTGMKVYWLDLDPNSSPDLGNLMHDVTAVDHSFSSGTGNLGQYDIFGHTFTTAGTVKYESAQQGSSMSGQIVVS